MIRGYAKIWASRIHKGSCTLADIDEADRADVRAMYFELFGEELEEEVEEINDV